MMQPIRILESIFTLNLFILSVDHIITGFLGVFFPKVGMKLYKKMYGAIMSEEPDYHLLFKPWGALAVFAAVVAVFPMCDPHRYKGVLGALLILLLMRIFNRISLHGSDYLGITKRRNLLHIVLIILCAALISAQLIYL